MSVRKNCHIMSAAIAIKDHIDSWYFGTSKND